MALENWESEHEPGDDEDVGEEEVGEDDGDGSGDDDDVGEHDGDGSSGASSGDTSEHDGNGDGSGYDGGPGSKRKRKMRKEFFPAYFLAANTGESSVDHFKRGVDPILIQNDARYKNTKHGRASTMDARLKIAFYKSWPLFLILFTTTIGEVNSMAVNCMLKPLNIENRDDVEELRQNPRQR